MDIEPSFTKENDGTYKVNINVDIASDLIRIIESLLELSQRIKKHAELKRSYDTANNRELIEKRQAEFERECITIYKRFVALTKKEFKNNKRGAVNRIKEEFGLKLSVEAEIRISEGRKASRKRENEARQPTLFIKE